LRNIPNDYIPNCCEEERARKILETDKFEIRKSLGIPSDRFVIMCVGSLQPRKGQNLIIEKLASIILHIPQALVCLVGSDPLGWKQELVKRVKEDLEDHVRFIPSQPSALEWIYAADVLLLPSKAEAMPRVVLEAMVLKTPVVAAQVDGVSELIEHSSSGWLFSHDKLEDMVKGLQTATFPEKSSRVVQAASTAYWENFSRAKLVERYCLAFAKIKSMH